MRTRHRGRRPALDRRDVGQDAQSTFDPNLPRWDQSRQARWNANSTLIFEPLKLPTSRATSPSASPSPTAVSWAALVIAIGKTASIGLASARTREARPHPVSRPRTGRRPHPAERTATGRRDAVPERFPGELGDGLAFASGELGGALSYFGCDAGDDLGEASGAAGLIDALVGDLVG